MARKIDAPSQCRRANEDLDRSIRKQLFHESTVLRWHSSLVNSEAEWQEVSQVAVLHVASFLRQDLSNRTIRLDELGNRFLLNGSISRT